MIDLYTLLAKLCRCAYTSDSSGGWSWRKYGDGTFDAYYKGTVNVHTSTVSAGYGGYRTPSLVNVAIPTELQGWTFNVIQVAKNQASSAWTNDYYRNGNNIGGFWHSGENANTTVTISLYCHGTWS